MIILVAALMTASGANAREASDGSRSVDNLADMAKAGQRNGSNTFYEVVNEFLRTRPHHFFAGRN